MDTTPPANQGPIAALIDSRSVKPGKISQWNLQAPVVIAFDDQVLRLKVYALNSQFIHIRSFMLRSAYTTPQAIRPDARR